MEASQQPRSQISYDVVEFVGENVIREALARVSAEPKRKVFVNEFPMKITG